MAYVCDDGKGKPASFAIAVAFFLSLFRFRVLLVGFWANLKDVITSSYNNHHHNILNEAL